jgi:hypothetical protein
LAANPPINRQSNGGKYNPNGGLTAFYRGKTMAAAEKHSRGKPPWEGGDGNAAQGFERNRLKVSSA